MILETLVLFFVVWLFGIALGFAAIARNHWVFKQRMVILTRPDWQDVYYQYEDYNTMFKKFWIWDIEKFKKVDKGS